jgi:hypothetical protein
MKQIVQAAFVIPERDLNRDFRDIAVNSSRSGMTKDWETGPE